MKFRDLGAQYSVLQLQIEKAIQKVIGRTSFILGPEVAELENQLAEYVGVKHCVSCASGTDALILVLEAWGIGKGDAVFAPDFTYFATINSAMRQGATVVLVDIDSRTFNMDPVALDKAIQKTLAEGKVIPKVIIPVDLFGQCANYPAIQKIADTYGLKILEDGAQGFGSQVGNRMACSFGEAGATSFFPAKPLGCYGDGGAVFTNDDDMDIHLRSLRAQGRSPKDKYDNREMGINSRLDTIQAAILLAKLEAFKNKEIQAVNQVAEKYTTSLAPYVVTPLIPEGFISSWAQYTILLKDENERSGLKSYLNEKDIPSMIYYPKGMHQQTALINAGFNGGDFPVTERIVKTCLSLPMHPYMSDEEISYITSCIIAYLKYPIKRL